MVAEDIIATMITRPMVNRRLTTTVKHLRRCPKLQQQLTAPIPMPSVSAFDKSPNPQLMKHWLIALQTAATRTIWRYGTNLTLSRPPRPLKVVMQSLLELRSSSCSRHPRLQGLL